MDELIFVAPNEDLEQAARGYKREHFMSGERELYGGAWFDKIDRYEDWLRLIRENSRPETVNQGWVLSTTFCVVRKRDERLIGMVDIRHELNDFLRSFGGHIGYGVRPSERNRGYGAQILDMAINYCRDIGIPRVMLICQRDNSAAIRTIQKNGGSLAREFPHSSGKIFRQYWVDARARERVDFDPDHRDAGEERAESRLFGYRRFANGQEFLIRPIVEDDAKAIISMTRTVDRETVFLSREPDEFSYTVEDQMDFIALRRSEHRSMWFVVESKGSMIASAQIRRVSGGERFSHRAKLSLLVTRDHWGIGVGTALLDSALTFAGLNGFEQAEIEVNVKNKRALDLLARFGFVPHGRVLNAYRYLDGTYSDMLLMTRVL